MAKYFTTNSKVKYGANFNKETNEVDFKLLSPSATDVTLCIFKKPMGDIPFLTVEMEKSGDVFKASISKDKLFHHKKVFYYAYRIFGPNFKKSLEYKEGSDIGFSSVLDNEGNRFNPNKLAYDPYGLELSHVQSVVSTDITAFRSGGKNYLSDNSKIAPKTVFRVIKEDKIQKAPMRAFKDEIIAEVHLKDLTRLTGVNSKGTYKGAKNFVKQIKKTGVTMVEFLPLHEFDSFIDKGNHWGYMSLSYFAIKKGFSSDKSPYGALYEFRKLINEFHKNGIKVCLDVVYNHTGEGRTYGDNTDAQLYSYALIDNRSYYKLAQNAHYTNHSGCGNDLNTLNPVSSDLIIDSLNFWINQGVDAFRFDLAVALMDTSTSGYAMYDKNGGVVSYLKRKLEDKGVYIKSQIQTTDGVDFIAEPWMCAGAYNYQLGNFPSYFSEWNDIFRDTVRAISVRPLDVTPSAMRNIIEGTPQKFGSEMRSVNYVSCHDGYTLFDLNTFDRPSKETEGGSYNELSSSYGGDVSEQDNAIRKQILILMISYGTPMLQFGDIFLHSKKGNNNSYNLDNEINRINYKLDNRKHNLNKYILELIKFRKENKIFTETYYKDRLEYLFPSGVQINNNDDSYWKNNYSNILCFKVVDPKNSFYIAISKDRNEIELNLPETLKNKKWHLLFDTKKDFANIKGKKYTDKKYILEPFSAVIFKEK